MKQINFEDLNRIFSSARISSYRSKNDDLESVIAKYNENIIICEAILPTLNYFEVCLRNNIDRVIKLNYSDNWMINHHNNFYMSEQDIQKIRILADKFQREKKQVITHDDLVAQMNFGFWCSFFHRRYDPILWHQKNALKNMFPNLPKDRRKRSEIENNILNIKKVRNRIAHHETIFNKRDTVIYVYNICHELIGAMSTEALMMLKSIDRFSTILSIDNI
jgi:hypothetical protein